ncbi:MAG: hypothetical protein GYA24_16230 [Candidatus Lokiarchaeota archaeon]|nr:hypothetical protein [Candidatus Lokiarchaeota archaeon]
MGLTVKTVLLICTCISAAMIAQGSVKQVEATRPSRAANVLVFSASPSSPLITSLGIDRDAINMTVITNSTMESITLARFNSTLHATDVFFIDRYLPGEVPYLHLIASHVNGTIRNAGLVMFGFLPDDEGFASIGVLAPLLPVMLGTNISAQVSTSDTGDAGYKVQVGLVTPVPAGSAIVARHIGWTSCPAISKRLVVDTKPGTSKLVIASDIGFTGTAIIAEWNASSTGSHVMFYSMILDLNKPFYLWPYFNYLVYVSVFHATTGYPDDAIESYAEWPFAPIPNPVQEILWFLLVCGFGAATIIITVVFKQRGDAEKRVEIGGDRS